MNYNRFKIQSYIRLAELCTPSEIATRQRYMEIIEQLLENLNDDSQSKAPVRNESITNFVKDCEELCVRIVNETVSNMYAEYLNYCTSNRFKPLPICEFSKQMQRQLNLNTVRKRLPGCRNLSSIFVEL